MFCVPFDPVLRDDHTFLTVSHHTPPPHTHTHTKPPSASDPRIIDHTMCALSVYDHTLMCVCVCVCVCDPSLSLMYHRQMRHTHGTHHTTPPHFTSTRPTPFLWSHPTHSQHPPLSPHNAKQACIDCPLLPFGSYRPASHTHTPHLSSPHNAKPPPHNPSEQNFLPGRIPNPCPTSHHHTKPSPYIDPSDPPFLRVCAFVCVYTHLSPPHTVCVHRAFSSFPLSLVCVCVCIESISSPHTAEAGLHQAMSDPGLSPWPHPIRTHTPIFSSQHTARPPFIDPKKSFRFSLGKSQLHQLQQISSPHNANRDRPSRSFPFSLAASQALTFFRPFPIPSSLAASSTIHPLLITTHTATQACTDPSKSFPFSLAHWEYTSSPHNAKQACTETAILRFLSMQMYCTSLHHTAAGLRSFSDPSDFSLAASIDRFDVEKLTSHHHTTPSRLAQNPSDPFPFSLADFSRKYTASSSPHTAKQACEHRDRSFPSPWPLLTRKNDLRSPIRKMPDRDKQSFPFSWPLLTAMHSISSPHNAKPPHIFSTRPILPFVSGRVSLTIHAQHYCTTLSLLHSSISIHALAPARAGGPFRTTQRRDKHVEHHPGLQETSKRAARNDQVAQDSRLARGLLT